MLGQAFGKLPFRSFSFLACKHRVWSGGAPFSELHPAGAEGEEPMGEVNGWESWSLCMLGRCWRFLEGSGGLTCLRVLLFPGEMAG